LRLLQNFLEMKAGMGRSNSVGEVFFTESIVASVFVSFPQIRPCFGRAYRVDQLAWHECCGGSGCQF